MSKRKTLLSKSVGLLSRSVMRTGAIVLTRRARLEAISAAISWFLKFIRYKSLELSHESEFGDFHLMSDGKRIQLTWWLTDMPPADGVNKSPTDKASSDVDADCDDTDNANDRTRTSTNASDCCDRATQTNRRGSTASQTYEVAEVGFQKWLEQVVEHRLDDIKDSQLKTAAQDPRATGNARARGSGGQH